MSGKKTVCFEPEAANFNVLNQNAYLNRRSSGGRLAAYNIALAQDLSCATMFVRHFGAAAHEKILGKEDQGERFYNFDSDFEQAVLTMSMDEFCRLRGVTPTDIKIDVDGAELPLVHGMRETLGNLDLKRIFIEISELDADCREALQVILDAGFEIRGKNRVQNYFDVNNYTLSRKS